jgi:hypothetical protein
MRDILLTHGYFLGEDEKERQIMRPYPTLGLLYLAAYLRRAGFGVEVFDTTFADWGDLLARLAAGPLGWSGLHQSHDPPAALDNGGGQGARWTESSWRSRGRRLSRGIPGSRADVVVHGEGSRPRRAA